MAEDVKIKFGGKKAFFASPPICKKTCIAIAARGYKKIAREKTHFLFASHRHAPPFF
ncbi:MAG: hypothetical protein ACLQQ4_06220 [Bacteroidia bacterium]